MHNSNWSNCQVFCYYLNMNHFKAIIFDLDGTIVDENSWTFMSKGLGISVSEHLKIYHAHRDGEISGERASKQLLKLWTSSPNANKTFLTNLFQTIPLRPDASEIIDYLKAKKYLICFITGSMDLFAKAIAQRLNIPSYYANASLHFDSAGKLNGYDYDITQADKKLIQLNDFCRNYQINMNECVPVGDSDNDKKIFLATGNGITIKTKYEDKELENLSWKVISNLTELKQYL